MNNAGQMQKNVIKWKKKMCKENKIFFVNGFKDGIPIGLGYFAVSFSLGIIAKKAGLTPFLGFFSSFLNHASAGEYALYNAIKAC